MTIPLVVEGLIYTGECTGTKLDSSQGVAWLKSISSFRFEPAGDSKPCTIRREPSGYWYGCRKVAGKVRKKYIGKSSEVNTAKLEEIAAALEVPPIPRVNKVAEVAQVAEVAEVAQVAEDRLTVLELEVANLRKAFEALQEILPGKLSSGDSTKLPKVADKVAEELQDELGNLKTENENLRQALESLKQELAENTRYYTARLNEAGATLGIFKDKLEAAQAKNQRLQNDLGNSQAGVTGLRSQLETERASRKEENENLRRSLENSDRLVNRKNQEVSELNSRLAATNQKISDSDEQLSEQFEELERQNAEIHNLKSKIQNLESELARLAGENSEKSAAASELPEAAGFFNRFKARRKKSGTTLADIETIFDMIEESRDDTSQGL